MDPVEIIIKLALLKFKPIGTKLAITETTIEIHEPNMLQGVNRWIYGYGRTTLMKLEQPLLQYIDTYCTFSSTHALQLLVYASYGIEKLIETYKDSDEIKKILVKYKSLLDYPQDYNKKMKKMNQSIEINLEPKWVTLEITILDNIFRLCCSHQKDPEKLISLIQLIENFLENYKKK